MALGRTLAALLLLLAAAAARAEEAGCPAVAARVGLVLDDPPPLLSADQGMAALHAESGAAEDPNRRQLGLTAATVGWSAEIAILWRAAPGGVCAVPERVSLRLAQTGHRIRIARELPRGGCLWRAVEAHERRHAAVNAATLRRAAGEMRRAAGAWAAGARARGPTPEAALDTLRAGLREALQPVLDGLRGARAAAHAAIDSPAEYARLSRLCPADQARLRASLPPG